MTVPFLREARVHSSDSLAKPREREGLHAAARGSPSVPEPQIFRANQEAEVIC